MNSVLLYNIKT